jgi:8-oxo-dGTP pyrophosphatase MutT (NUDIX family)
MEGSLVCGMAETPPPRLAATVMMLRDGQQGYEILMLRRNLQSDFVGGAYVFPGGGVDHADGELATRRLVVGLNDEEASRRLNLASGGLAYYVASLRELFEEAGLLVACSANGEPRRFNDVDTIRRMATHRRAVNDGTLDFGDMLEREELCLDVRELEYVAHWVTPVGPPRRFDTRFFIAMAPVGQVATHDAGETIADRWVRPIDALNAFERRELDMIMPTIRNLEAIADFTTARDVVNHARSLEHIARIEPRMVRSGDDLIILLPGDAGYETR